MNYRIAAIGSAFEPHHIQMLQQVAEKNACSIQFFETNEQSIPHLENVDIIFAPSNAQSPAMVKSAPNLKWFASYFAGVDPLLVPGVLDENVILTNGSGSYGITIAEHMIMTALMLVRRYPEYHAIVENRDFRSDLMIGSLYGADVLVCGTGDIGTTFAKRLRSFDPKRIIGVNRSGHSVDGFDKVIPISQIDDYISEADIVALALPSTRQTDNLISKERIASMKKTAFLINVGRGNCIDQKALVDALNNGNLAGAALDVFEVEPIPKDDPLWETKNLLITPHCAGKMTMAYTRDTLVSSFCDNLSRFVNGEALLHLVNRKNGY